MSAYVRTLSSCPTYDSAGKKEECRKAIKSHHYDALKALDECGHNTNDSDNQCRTTTECTIVYERRNFVCRESLRNRAKVLDQDDRECQDYDAKEELQNS